MNENEIYSLAMIKACIGNLYMAALLSLSVLGSMV